VQCFKNRKLIMAALGQARRSPLRRSDAVIVFLMIVLAWANTLFTYLPAMSAYPPKITVEVAADGDPTDAVPIQALTSVGKTWDSPRDKVVREASALTAVVATANNEVAMEGAASAPTPVSPTATENVAETTPSAVLPSSNSFGDAKDYLKRGIASYWDGAFSVAIADFDVAIQLDPNFEDAYIDQGIAWYRIGNSDRAFADVAQAIRIQNSHNQIGTPPLPRASPLLSEAVR